MSGRLASRAHVAACARRGGHPEPAPAAWADADIGVLTLFLTCAAAMEWGAEVRSEWEAACLWAAIGAWADGWAALGRADAPGAPDRAWDAAQDALWAGPWAPPPGWDAPPLGPEDPREVVPDLAHTLACEIATCRGVWLEDRADRVRVFDDLATLARSAAASLARPPEPPF